MKTRICVSGIILLVLAFNAAAAAERHPMTPEDLWNMKRIGSIELSPCGEWAAVTVTERAANPTKLKVNAFLNIAISPRFPSSPPLAASLPGEYG